MPNHLESETSPYLLQHADNPVDWHPWGPAALSLARDERKPILLSVGYSACHWCHVMAHESFEDEATAAVMNELYINIKVDREERPDLDRIYQTAQRLFSGRAGGWPLTVFLTPDEHLPIFAGTYFPKTAVSGMPAFKDVLTQVESYYRNNKQEVAENGQKLIVALERLNAVDADSASELSTEPMVAARRWFGESFDAEYGGFGGAPKFPHGSNLDVLIAFWQRTVNAGEEDLAARRMIELSLDRMATGGLYDHLGGGFFRYCVDREWRIPHFEKMLYDNASLLSTYSTAYAATGHARYAQAASETADWVLRDMQDEDGGFYATLDADSEGEEGKFYVFEPDEFEALLEPDEAAIARAYYGLNEPANFEGRHWHLQVRARGEKAPQRNAALERARAKLLVARNARTWPQRDEKCIVSWNGLMIGGLARAARYLERPDLAAAAQRAVDFIRAQLWRDGRLKSVYKDGQARFQGYLDDYAFLAAGLIELMQVEFRASDLKFATELADAMIDHFPDPQGGFFFTAHDHERLVYRPKPLADEAVPAGNAIAVLALNGLGHLLGEARYLQAAERTVRSAWPLIERYPVAHATLLRGVERALEPPELVIVRGKKDALTSWRAAVDRAYHPDRLLFFIADEIDDLPGLLSSRSAGSATTAYVCSGTQCLAPIQDLGELRKVLQLDLAA